MADQVKVFKNEVGTNQTGSASAFSISGMTTDSSTKAVVKDAQLKISPQNSLYNDIYKFPLKVKLNNYPVYSTDDGRSVTLTGSQIVDSSSTFSFEVQPETPQNYFQEIGIFRSVNARLRFQTSNVNSLSDSDREDSQTIIDNLSELQDIGSPITGDGSTVFLKDGVWVLAYLSSNVMRFINQSGESLGSVNMPFATYQLTQDDTYIYAANANATGTNQFARVLKSNLTTYSYFSATSYLAGISNSNPGFFEHYDGFLYHRAAGGSNNLQKISLATGAVTNISFGIGQTEHLGARIVLNNLGVPHIVEWGDSSGKVYNLNTNSQAGGTISLPAGVADPTTTNNNHTIVIAPGVMLVNNKSYNQTWVVNINAPNASGSFTATNTTSTFTCSSGSNIIGSSPLQVAGVVVPRDINYDLLISGIESV